MICLKKDYEQSLKLINEQLHSQKQSDLSSVPRHLQAASQHGPGCITVIDDTFILVVKFIKFLSGGLVICQNCVVSLPYCTKLSL